MATKTLTQIFNEVAEAIQEKKGSSTPISAEDFGTEIANLPSGGSEDPNVFTIPYNADLILHLDKLKQYLPTEILNTHLTYYNYYGEQYCLGIQVSDEVVGPIHVRFSYFAANAYSSYTTYSCEITTKDINTETEPYTLSEVEFMSFALAPVHRNNITISDGMTVSELIDNIITANGSNNVTLPWAESTWDSEDMISLSSLNVTIYGDDPNGCTKCIASNKILTNSQLKEIFTVAE